MQRVILLHISLTISSFMRSKYEEMKDETDGFCSAWSLSTYVETFVAPSAPNSQRYIVLAYLAETLYQENISPSPPQQLPYWLNVPWSSSIPPPCSNNCSLQWYWEWCPLQLKPEAACLIGRWHCPHEGSFQPVSIVLKERRYVGQSPHRGLATLGALGAFWLNPSILPV